MILTEAEMEVLKTLPVVTRKRVAALAAFGLSDQQIADVQLLELSQVEVCKKSDEYILAFAQSVNERVQMQMDLAEGWDAVEEKALSQVFETLQYNRNPNFALLAARMANQAKRRQIEGADGRIIDNKPVNNIIQLNLNKTYITNIQTKIQNNTEVISQEARPLAEIPRKRQDVPTPKMVEQLLTPSDKIQKPKNMFENVFEEAGVVVSEFEKDAAE